MLSPVRPSLLSWALFLLGAVVACDTPSEPRREAATATAPTVPAAPGGLDSPEALVSPKGLYCSVEAEASCYDIDPKASTVTLVMGDSRGKTYPLEKSEDGGLAFAITPDHRVELRLRDADTLEAKSPGSSTSTVLERRR